MQNSCLNSDVLKWNISQRSAVQAVHPGPVWCSTYASVNTHNTDVCNSQPSDCVSLELSQYFILGLPNLPSVSRDSQHGFQTISLKWNDKCLIVDYQSPKSSQQNPVLSLGKLYTSLESFTFPVPFSFLLCYLRTLIVHWEVIAVKRCQSQQQTDRTGSGFVRMASCGIMEPYVRLVMIGAAMKPPQPNQMIKVANVVMQTFLHNRMFVCFYAQLHDF